VPITDSPVVHPDAPLVKKYLLAVRPMFLTASILPVLLGTAIGVSSVAQFDVAAFVLALFSVMLAHAGVNVLNDVYDDLNGTDRFNDERISPFTGGSRFIQDEVLSQSQMRRWGHLLLTISAILGLILILHKGLIVLGLGLTGLLLGVAYSAPPLALASRGLGELAVGIGFGVLPVVGAAWLQTGFFSWEALLLSVPVSIWVANILLVNEVPDYTADSKAGKNTLVVRLGFRWSALLYVLLNAVALATLVWGTVLGYLPAPALIVCGVLFVLALLAGRIMMKWQAHPEQMAVAIKLTLAIHAVNCIGLLGWYIAG
jgi:1,4-dihydroxy-2-naphthoate octaprenyltransferase